MGKNNYHKWCCLRKEKLIAKIELSAPNERTPICLLFPLGEQNHCVWYAQLVYVRLFNKDRKVYCNTLLPVRPVQKEETSIRPLMRCEEWAIEPKQVVSLTTEGNPSMDMNNRWFKISNLQKILNSHTEQQNAGEWKTEKMFKSLIQLLKLVL